MAMMSKVRTLYTVYSIYSESTDRKTTYDGYQGLVPRVGQLRKFRNSLIDVPTFINLLSPL